MRWKGLRFVVVVVSLVYILHTRILYYIRIIRVYTYCVTYCQSNGENNHFDHSSFGTLSALYTHARVLERGVSLGPARRPLEGRKSVFSSVKRVPVWVQVLCAGRGEVVAYFPKLLNAERVSSGSARQTYTHAFAHTFEDDR